MAQASARHILVSTEAKANELKTAIENGADFAQLAKENSSCPSSRDGGNLGTFGPGQMVKEFDTVVFSAPVGEVQGPVKTQFGYHWSKSPAAGLIPPRQVARPPPDTSGGGFLLPATDAGSIRLHAVPRPQCVGPPPRLMTSFQLLWNGSPNRTCHEPGRSSSGPCAAPQHRISYQLIISVQVTALRYDRMACTRRRQPGPQNREVPGP